LEKIYSKTNPGILLHVVNRLSDIVERTDIAPAKEFIQLATLRMQKGKTFKPHKHIWKPGEKTVIAQESWVVISGRVRCLLYDLDDELIASPIIGPGDCSMTFEGGHTYEILEEDTIVYEYKTGPYRGQMKDKEFI